MTFVFALLAGLLSTLSPCVLPLVPLVLSAATAEHRWGPAALAAGLALSFTVIGVFVATIGFAIGLDGDLFRALAALIMIAIGVVLMVPDMQARLAVAAGPVASFAENRFGGTSRAGLGGQFAVGLLLGAVWAPCVGPTLGAASVLAANGESLAQVTLTMALFGIGAALPLLALGALSREAMLRLRGRLAMVGKTGKLMFGGLFVVVGLAILTGLDKTVEAQLVAWSPEWLTALTTRF
jgi:cytochrome c biogenesis protein CcdA